MENWQSAETQKDIEQLMSAYGDFHDACIVSLNFQRQWEPKTIELQFIGLRQLHLIGWQDNYLCNILEAYLAFHDNLLPGKPHRVIVWSDNSCFDAAEIGSTIQEPADTYIVSNVLRWRIKE